MAEKKPKKLRPDINEVAHRIMREATGQAPKTKPPADRSESEKDAEATARGSTGGKKGGAARKKKLTDEQRTEIAKKAAAARWSKTTSP